MLIENQHPLNKSVMIAMLGKPNAGKSSLINCLLGFDLAIVSNKPQTTRNQFHCAFTIDRTEVILVDTPGVHKSNQEMNKRMVGQARFGAEGAELNFLLLDLTLDIEAEFDDFIDSLGDKLARTWIIFTKSDLSKKSQEAIQDSFDKIQMKLPVIEKYFVISSKTEDNIHALTGAICDLAQSGPHLYPKGHVSNKNERFFVSEYIREQAFSILRDELPYECAVTVEEFNDLRNVNGEDPTKMQANISATILVNRPSQRAIVVGRQGTVIKEIGVNARKKIEALVGGKVFLNLHVKVKPKWFKNNFVLEELGLPRVQDSNRVWRAPQ